MQLPGEAELPYPRVWPVSVRAVSCSSLAHLPTPGDLPALPPTRCLLKPRKKLPQPITKSFQHLTFLADLKITAPFPPLNEIKNKTMRPACLQ